jgi:K+-sensing histidine kinase KdpD
MRRFFQGVAHLLMAISPGKGLECIMKTKAKNERQKHSNSFEQEREKLHRAVLTSVSHDLKTPLSCIIGSLEIYERTKEKLTLDKKNILINTALQEAYRLDSFVTNILDMARLESGAVKVKKELYVMDLLLEDCRISLGQRLLGCDISIKAIPATFPVTTDSLLLMRAICIVLDNAARYASLHPAIGVEYEKVGKQTIIRIQDNGPGIPKEKMEEIFSKYASFAIQDHKHSGTGLGLPICREIMRLLDGTVTVTNLPAGKGAVFTLAFAA